MSSIITSADISAMGIDEELKSRGIDLNQDITEIAYDGWETGRATGDFRDTIFTHQIPQLIIAHALNPDLWGQTMAFMGPSAIGKTEVIREGLEQAVAMMNQHRDSPRILVNQEVHVSQMGPVDAMGVPRERDGRTYWAPPEIWPLAEVMERSFGYNSKVNRFLAHYAKTGEKDWNMMPEQWVTHFHDEVTNPSNPSVVHQLFPAWCGTSDGKMMGNHLLTKDFFTILAGNRVEDRTNSINLATSAVTRMGIMEVVPHYPGWLKFFAFKAKNPNRPTSEGGATKIHPTVIAYLNKNNKNFAPQDKEDRAPMTPFPTPRAWKYVSDILYSVPDMPQELLQALIAGRVGTPTATDFFTYLKFFRDIPDIDLCLKGDKRALAKWPDPKRIDLMYIVGSQLVVKLTEKTAKGFMAIINDPKLMPLENGSMVMKQLRPAGKLVDLVHTWDPEGFKTWTRNNKNLFF